MVLILVSHRERAELPVFLFPKYSHVRKVTHCFENFLKYNYRTMDKSQANLRDKYLAKGRTKHSFIKGYIVQQCGYRHLWVLTHLTFHIPSAECNKVVSVFSSFCGKSNFVLKFPLYFIVFWHLISSIKMWLLWVDQTCIMAQNVSFYLYFQ